MPFPRLGAPCVVPAVLIAPTPLPVVPRAAPLLVELAAEFGVFRHNREKWILSGMRTLVTYGCGVVRPSEVRRLVTAAQSRYDRLVAGLDLLVREMCRKVCFDDMRQQRGLQYSGQYYSHIGGL